jgi:hypothetical protein
MNSMTVLLHVHLAATLFMVGVIWFVQVVHYPLFSRVGASGFPAYEREHVRRTGWVLMAPMLVELGLSVWAAWSLGGWVAWVGLVLIAVIWAVTWAVQVPAHRRLETGFDPVVCRRLVRSNWTRTAAWTLRGGMAVALILKAP